MGDPILFAPGTSVVAVDCSLAKLPREMKLFLHPNIFLYNELVHAYSKFPVKTAAAGQTARKQIQES